MFWVRWVSAGSLLHFFTKSEKQLRLHSLSLKLLQHLKLKLRFMWCSTFSRFSSDLNGLKQFVCPGPSLPRQTWHDVSHKWHITILSACKYWQLSLICPNLSQVNDLPHCIIFLTDWQLTGRQCSQCQGYIIIWAHWCQPWLMLTWIHPCRALQQHNVDQRVSCAMLPWLPCHTGTLPPLHGISLHNVDKITDNPLQISCFLLHFLTKIQPFKRSPWLVKKLIERQ